MQTEVREPTISPYSTSLSRRVVEWLDPPRDFNYRHFRMRHMLAELVRGAADHVIAPGQPAPDFALEGARGEHVRLLDLRGRPVLLHFVSYTCPVTRGGVVPMCELHRRYGTRVQFLEVVVRQAHPGEHHGGYRAYADKLDDARQYAEEEGVAWPVLVDDLDATVQRAYGGLAAAVYLIDADGRVAFCGAWDLSSALTGAIDDLLSRGGSGTPAGSGFDPLPHLGGAFVAGQGGPLRGGIQSLVDLELGFPGALVLMTLGRLARPVLAPLVLRVDPLPARTKLALIAGVTAWAMAAFCLVQELGVCRRGAALPHARNEPFSASLELGVRRAKLPMEKLLLVADPRDVSNEEADDDNQQADPVAEGQCQPDERQERSGVARVANEAVRT